VKAANYATGLDQRWICPSQACFHNRLAVERGCPQTPGGLRGHYRLLLVLRQGKMAGMQTAIAGRFRLEYRLVSRIVLGAVRASLKREAGCLEQCIFLWCRRHR
jgi:hypothetical protein